MSGGTVVGLGILTHMKTPSQSKSCTKCKVTKLVECFSTHKQMSDGLQLWCKDCTNHHHAEYYAANHEQILKKQREYRVASQEQIRKSKQKYYAANQEQIRKKHREYYAANSEKRLSKDKQEYHANPDVKKRIRAANIKRKYGLSLSDYECLATKQGGTCAICKLLNSSQRTLCVDHCHATGQSRGLLCNDCNFMIGRIEKDRRYAYGLQSQPVWDYMYTWAI